MVFLKGKQSRKYFLAVAVLLNGRRMEPGEEEGMFVFAPSRGGVSNGVQFQFKNFLSFQMSFACIPNILVE